MNGVCVSSARLSPLALARSLPLLTLLAGSLAAGPAPTELTAQSFEASSLHLAGGEGAINSRRKVRLHFTLLPDHRLVGEEIGERYENNLFRDYSTQDETQWQQRYTGRYSYVGAQLRLDLELVDRRCSHRRTRNSQPPGEVLPCAPVSLRLRIDCDSERLVLTPRNAAPTAAPGSTQAAWRCHLAEAGELADSPLPWVFGKAEAGAPGVCIETTPRFHSSPPVYRLCPR